MTPGILNGLYVSSYVFLGHMPENLTCVIPKLTQAYWSYDEIKNISTRLLRASYYEAHQTDKQVLKLFLFRLVADKCKIRNWNYTLLSEYNFDNAYQYIATIELPSEIPCKKNEENFFYYDNEGLSIVPEVCTKFTKRLKSFE